MIGWRTGAATPTPTRDACSDADKAGGNNAGETGGAAARAREEAAAPADADGAVVEPSSWKKAVCWLYH